MKYTYYDGAGNKYKIADMKISYTPTKPEQSSSGFYDGGEPSVKDLSKLDMIKMVDVFERAIWEVNDHIENREMGSGMIIKDLGSQGVSTLVIKGKSNSNLNIIELLKTYK